MVTSKQLRELHSGLKTMKILVALTRCVPNQHNQSTMRSCINSMVMQVEAMIDAVEKEEHQLDCMPVLKE